jgi:hypothetical protein
VFLPFFRGRGILTALAASSVLLACAADRSGFPQVNGWTQSGEARVYTAENLWEYIDGAALLFEEYGVRTCTTADLSSEGVAVTVDLYEMASALGAVGVFRREAPGAETRVSGATVASLSPPYQALMVKGSTYVKVNAWEGEITEAGGRLLLEGLASSIPGEVAMPSEFSLLPREGRVGGSEGYQPGPFLSLAELRDCIYAEYRGGEGETWQGFVVLPSSAPAVWEALSEGWASLEGEEPPAVFREVPYSGLVGVTRTESGVFGVSGATDTAQLRERLAAFGAGR